jgi:hypothetical protein
MAKDLLLTLADRPGEGARMGEALGAAGLNIEGVCAITSEGQATVHVLVEDAGAARAALEGAGIKVEGETDVIVGDLSAVVDKPGTLGDMTRQLADAGVNITLIYLATKNRCVIATTDNGKARGILGMTS